jgi:hypothetical protein
VYIQLFCDRDSFAYHQLVSVTGNHDPSLVANVANVASNRSATTAQSINPAAIP